MGKDSDVEKGSAGDGKKGPLSALPSLGPIAPIIWLPVKLPLPLRLPRLSHVFGAISNLGTLCSPGSASGSRLSQVIFLVVLTIVLAVVLTLPESYSCDPKEEAYFIKIVDEPRIDMAIPPLICPFRKDIPIMVEGHSYIIWNGRKPEFTLDGNQSLPILIGPNENAYVTNTSSQVGTNCTELKFRGQTVFQCAAFDVVIPMRNYTDPYAATLRHPPSIDNPDPDVPTPMHPAAQTNSFPCYAESSVALFLIPPPVVQSTSPALICLSSTPSRIDVSGKGFSFINDVAPIVKLATFTAPMSGVRPQSQASCPTLPVARTNVSNCNALSFDTTLAMRDDVDANRPREVALTVTPNGFDECASDPLTVPVINAPEVLSASPATLCIKQTTTQEVTITSPRGFLVKNNGAADSDYPALVLNGLAITKSTHALSHTNCTSSTLLNTAVLACSALTFTVTPSALPLGSDFALTQPAPFASCASTTTALRVISSEVTYSSALPSTICSREGGTVTLTGTNLATLAIVSLTQDCSSVAPPCPNEFKFTTTVTTLSNTTANATFGPGLVPSGRYFLGSGDGSNACDYVSTVAINVRPFVFALFVDPPVISNLIDTSATVFVSGIGNDSVVVEMIDADDKAQVLTQIPTSEPNSVLVVVPRGNPAGSYDIRVTTEFGCSDRRNGAFTITNQTDLNVTAISSNFASASLFTGLTVSGVGFQEIPRIYLAPKDTSLRGIPVESVSFVSSTELTIGIPVNSTPGLYDLLVVNPAPDLSVGILRDALRITTDPLPSISNVERGFFDSGGGGNTNFTISGANFDSNASVAVFCDGDQWRTVAASDVLGPRNSTRIGGINFDPVLAGLPSSIGCLIRVTNNNNASAIFSALPRKNGQARNLAGSWTNNTSLRQARRDHAMVQAQINAASKFFYVIGGDNRSSTFANIEYAQIAVDASLSPFLELPSDLNLPAPLTSVRAALVNNFIYIAGGRLSNGSASNAVMRAEILDEQKRPNAGLTVDLVTSSEPNNTFVPGLWYWAVSALYPADHPTNPGGESLPSFVVPAVLPNIPELPLLKLIVGWNVIPGASGYRIYRAGPNESATMLRPIADVPGGNNQSYVDRGAAAVAGRGPLPLGAIGKWDTRLPRLTQARDRHTVVAVTTPGNASQTFLYAFGGHNGTAFLNSMELLTIDNSATQPYSTWTLGTSLPFARADLSAWVHDSRNTPAYVAAGDVFIALGSGSQATSTGANDVYQGQVLSNGSITFTNSGQSQTSAVVNWCAFTSTEISYWAGGHGPQSLTASASVNKFVLTGTGLPIPPLLPGQTATGTSMLQARSAMGCGIANAHLYVAGGQDAGSATGNILNSVEYVLF